MTDLNALAVFAKVVEAKSFSSAARCLGMPLSTVSRRVAELENAVGERLLIRSTRSLKLTEAGSRIIGQARSAADINDTVDALLARTRTVSVATLRLSAPPSISDTFLAPLIAAFRQSYPDIGVKAFIAGRIEETLAQDIDLEVKVGPRRDHAWVGQPLLSYRHQLVASPSYLAGARPIAHPRDLLDHPLLAFAFSGAENSWTLSEVGGHGREVLRFRPHVAMGDYAGLTALMLADRGIGDLPPIVQPELMRNHRLMEVLPGWELPMFDLYLASAQMRHSSQAVGLFNNFAAEVVPAMFPAHSRA